jgi:hypothetical protein
LVGSPGGQIPPGGFQGSALTFLPPIALAPVDRAARIHVRVGISNFPAQ